MPTYEELTANRARAQMGEGDDPLRLEYFPLRITAEHIRRFTELSLIEQTLERRVEGLEAIADEAERAGAVLDEAIRPIDGVIDILLEVLAGWNLTRVKNGPTVPITRAELEPLGIGFNSAVLATIFSSRGDGLSKPNGTSPSTRLNGSSIPRARRTTSRTATSRKRSR